MWMGELYYWSCLSVLSSPDWVLLSYFYFGLCSFRGEERGSQSPTFLRTSSKDLSVVPLRPPAGQPSLRHRLEAVEGAGVPGAEAVARPPLRKRLVLGPAAAAAVGVALWCQFHLSWLSFFSILVTI